MQAIAKYICTYILSAFRFVNYTNAKKYSASDLKLTKNNYTNFFYRVDWGTHRNFSLMASRS